MRTGEKSFMRKECKRRAKTTLRKSYWRVLLVFVVISYLTGASGALGILTTYNQSYQEGEGYNPLKGKSNSEIIAEIVNPSGERIPEEERPTRGVFAGIFNNITDSGSFVFGILNSVNQTFFQDKIVAGIVIFIGALIMFLFWMFVQNVLIAGQCRFFLECSSYYGTEFTRVAYAFTHKKVVNTAFVILRMKVYHYLWTFTVIGGIIKYFSYFMVPYIVAENPAICGKDAILLSRKMMKGNKRKLFVLMLSFAGWYVLGMLTMGIVNFLFSGPYRQAVYAEYYKQLRKELLEKEPELKIYYNDLALYPDQPAPGKYPVEQFPLPVRRSRNWVSLDYQRKYSISSIILFFFTFSAIGWMWEVGLHLFTDGVFVNRGVLHGPWLPIYGSGGILIILLLKRFAHRPVITYFMIVLTCGILEYSTSWYLEKFLHKKWWDYSGYFLNLNGRVCAEGLFIFGVGGCAFIYILAPLLDNLYRRINKKVQIVLCAVLLIVFCTDFVWSHIHPNTGKGITDYGTEEKDENIENSNSHLSYLNSYNTECTACGSRRNAAI